MKGSTSALQGRHSAALMLHQKHQQSLQQSLSTTSTTAESPKLKSKLKQKLKPTKKPKEGLTRATCTISSLWIAVLTAIIIMSTTRSIHTIRTRTRTRTRTIHSHSHSTSTITIILRALTTSSSPFTSTAASTKRQILFSLPIAVTAFQLQPTRTKIHTLTPSSASASASSQRQQSIKLTNNKYFHSSSHTLLFATTPTPSNTNNSNNNNNNNSNTNNTSNNNYKQTSTTTASYIEPSLSGYKPPAVNWYPGHIAKAERTLSETLTSADVLIEIRDARIPKATSHPRVREWTVGKPRIVVLTRLDTVPKASVRTWSDALNLFGAGKWDQFIQDGNLRHRARQNMMTRGINVSKQTKGRNFNNKHKNNNHNNNTNNPDELGLVEDVIYVDAKRGSGTPALLRAIGRSGSYVNEKRVARGLRERPLRVAVLGYPNVGKSALINRILGRKRAKSANTPGITRSLQWIRVRGDLDGTDVTGRARMTKSKVNKGMRAGDFELLDSPGIIPANMDNQEDAILLAICNSVGNNAYDNQGVAAYLCERLKTLHLMGDETIRVTAPVWRQKSIERYGFDPLKPMMVPTLDIESEEQTRIPTGEDMLFQVAENTCRGDPENAARKILQDFRNGRMGPICLQLAPKLKEENKSEEEEDSGGESFVPVRREVALLGELLDLDQGRQMSLHDSDERRRERAESAMRAAKERGLELPPMVEDQMQQNDADEDVEKNEQNAEVGKGLFDGW